MKKIPICDKNDPKKPKKCLKKTENGKEKKGHNLDLGTWTEMITGEEFNLEKEKQTNPGESKTWRKVKNTISATHSQVQKKDKTKLQPRF